MRYYEYERNLDRNKEYPEEALRFDSLLEMARFVDPNVASGQGAWSSELDYHRKHIEDAVYLASNDTIMGGTDHFNRTSNIQEAIHLAKHGWKAGRERLAEWSVALEREFRKRIAKPSFVQDLAGIEVDVPALLSGDPEHMLDYQQAQANARYVKLVVDLNVRCDACGERHHDASPTPPEWVLTRGAAITMLIRGLILANYQPEVVVRTTALYRGQYNSEVRPGLWPSCFSKPFLRTIEVPIHRPSEVFDIDRINFALSHDSFTRRLEFRVHEIMNSYYMNGRLQTSATGTAGRSTDDFVGFMPLRTSWMSKYRSQRDYGDLFVPSPALAMDAAMVKRRTKEEGDYQLPQSLALESNDEGVQYPKAFSSPVGAITWVFDVLDGLGVQLT